MYDYILPSILFIIIKDILDLYLRIISFQIGGICTILYECDMLKFTFIYKLFKGIMDYKICETI
jgi:hypothetical protein